MSDRQRTYQRERYVTGTAARNLREPSYTGRRKTVRPARTKSSLAYQDDYYEYYEPSEKERIRERRERNGRSVKKEKSFDMFSALMLTAAVAITGFVCVSYLSVQSEIMSTKKEISAIELEIADLESQNETAREQVEDSVDLKKVYKIATKELGMVHPEKNQVISYESTKSDSVRQYGEIPEEDKGTLWNVLDEKKK